jgi:hypothetical protein
MDTETLMASTRIARRAEEAEVTPRVVVGMD